MMEIIIPGQKELKLTHLVLDYNGTLARDGFLLENVKEHLEILAHHLQIHILTADTFGKAQIELKGIPVRLSILRSDEQDKAKLEYIQVLGAEHTICIGNGLNDRLMLQEAALGIAVVQLEGAARESLLAADVICPSIGSALELLMNPQRLVATLRV